MQNGNYSVRVTSANGCAGIGEMNVTGVGVAPAGEIVFEVQPNPSSQAVHLTLPQGFAQFEIFNAVGQLVYESKVSSLHHVVDVSKFSEGVYFVRVRSHQGVQTQKFVVQR